MSDARIILNTRCPLPITRVGAVQRLWLRLQTAGLLKLTGLTSAPVSIDAYRVESVFSKKQLLRVTITCEDMAATAGSTISASDALSKAFSELCECFQLFDEKHVLGRTRNGFAAHSDERSARERAYRELIERDSLVTHFLCSEVRAIPLTAPREVTMPIQLAELWSADPDIRVVLCGLQDRPDPRWFLGAAASRNLHEAVEKAYVECVSIYCGYRHADEVTDPVGPRQAEILKHISASKDAAMRENLKSIFSGSGNKTPQFTTTMADASFRTLARLGKTVVVVSARHPLLCSLNFEPVWSATKQETIGLLESRGLEPIWAKHPFA